VSTKNRFETLFPEGLLMVLAGWLKRRERAALAYLIAENRFLRRQLGARRLRLTDERPTAARDAILSSGPSGVARDRHHHDARYAASVASAVHREQMDVCDAAGESSRRAQRDSAPGRADVLQR